MHPETMRNFRTIQQRTKAQNFMALNIFIDFLKGLIKSEQLPFSSEFLFKFFNKRNGTSVSHAFYLKDWMGRKK